MPRKLQIYMERAEAAMLQLTADYRTWISFLETASRVYKYRFLEQAMIYAQKPDAVACAEYDLWKNRMRRFVYRGTTGIGLISYIGGDPILRYVFDVSDTGEKEGALYPDLWHYQSEHEPTVTAALESQYQVLGKDGLVKQLARLSAQLAEERWDNYQEDILSSVQDSFLEELDELNIRQRFQRSAAASIAYATLSRCGLKPKRYLEPEDFRDIPDFNTVPAITQMDEAVSEATGQVLRQIEAAVKAYRPQTGKPVQKTTEQSSKPRQRANASQEEKLPRVPANPKIKAERRPKTKTDQHPQEQSKPEPATEDVNASSAVSVSKDISQDGSDVPVPGSKAPSYQISERR